MPSPVDLDINRRVRRILVKHWIDLGRISIRTIQGVVIVYGRLQRIPGRDQLIPPIVEAIFEEVRALKQVRGLRAHLENWSRDGGLWRPIKEPEQTGP